MAPEFILPKGARDRTASLLISHGWGWIQDHGASWGWASKVVLSSPGCSGRQGPLGEVRPASAAHVYSQREAESWKVTCQRIDVAPNSSSSKPAKWPTASHFTPHSPDFLCPEMGIMLVFIFQNYYQDLTRQYKWKGLALMLAIINYSSCHCGFCLDRPRAGKGAAQLVLRSLWRVAYSSEAQKGCFLIG